MNTEEDTRIYTCVLPMTETQRYGGAFTEPLQLRDQFAMAALSGLMLRPAAFDSWELLANTAYCFADEMLRAREREVK